MIVPGVQRVAPTVELADEFADFEIREDLEQDLEKRLAETVDDIRPALKSFTPVADADQQDVISSDARTIRLVAPAGAGKTQTIVNRILGRVAKGSRPDRILCLTFDNSAARALREKVEETAAHAGAAIDQFQITTLIRT